MKKLLMLTTAMAMLVGQVQGQEYYDETQAYDDSNRASTMSALLPIGALVVAAIIIATTDRHHHHHRDSSCGSSSHAHAHFSSSSL
ncbi:hypothetical protein [Candidatus Protochlamydia amoebophila]|uniref:Uncharacterized protein n=1 Tax=Protochlamydia amoebophila (strain UWE25) TaxID=264201 RepID=A0A2P9HA98_PARUW|nr:hypothetical protein [Candidatus Protochlamydia amoebophila]SPJ31923.1 unnamed protein product [Candidatus Protochlamydia amoebophila UWE25]